MVEPLLAALVGNAFDLAFRIVDDCVVLLGSVFRIRRADDGCIRVRVGEIVGEIALRNSAPGIARTIRKCYDPVSPDCSHEEARRMIIKGKELIKDECKFS